MDGIAVARPPSRGRRCRCRGWRGRLATRVVLPRARSSGSTPATRCRPGTDTVVDARAAAAAGRRRRPRHRRAGGGDLAHATAGTSARPPRTSRRASCSCPRGGGCARRPGRRGGRRARDAGRGPAARGRDHPDRGRDPAGRRGAAPRRHHRHQLAHARRAVPPGSARVPAVSAVQPDDPDALAAEIRRAAADADLVLVIAGSSRGRGDHAAAVLAQVGGVAVAGVAVRPGHPVLLGHAKRPDGSHGTPGAPGIVPGVGLPGYPLAAAVIFELFALPLLAAIGGQAARPPDARPAAGPRLVLPGRRRGMGPVRLTAAPRPRPARRRPGAARARSAASPAPTPGGRSRPARALSRPAPRSRSGRSLATTPPNAAS